MNISKITLLISILLISASVTSAAGFLGNKINFDHAQQLHSLLSEADHLWDFINSHSNQLLTTPIYLMQLFTSSNEFGKKAYPLCGLCNDVVEVGKLIMESEPMTQLLIPVAVKVCQQKVANDTVCPEMAKQLVPVFTDGFTERFLRKGYTCANLHLCKMDYRIQTLDDYIKRIMSDKPAKNTNSHPKPALTEPKNFTVMHMSDLHVDFTYQVGANAHCNEMYCCQAKNGQPENPKDGAQYWGTPNAPCDIPLRTVEQFIQFVAKYIKPDLVLWTGDNLSHNVWDQNKTSPINSNKIIAGLIEKYMSGTKIVASIGNHDCFPMDQCGGADNSTAWLSVGLADAWSSFLQNASYTAMKENSFYSEFYPEWNLRVLALNTEVCDERDFNVLRNPTDPLGQLAWVEELLRGAEKNNENIYITGHIPPALVGCYPDWAGRYNALIERFSGVVKGQFFAHTHTEDLHITRSFNNSAPTGYIMTTSSVTTNLERQPAFRLYQVDTVSAEPQDYDQYRLNISYYNEFNHTGPLIWEKAYTFTSEYNVTDMSVETVSKIAESMKTDPIVVATYLYNKYTGLQKFKIPNNRTMHATYCDTNYGYYPEIAKCLSEGGIDVVKDPFINGDNAGPWYYFDKE